MNQQEPEQFDPQQNDPIKKMGIGFSFAMWIGILAVLYFFASGIIEKQYNPNSQPDFSEQQGVKQVQLKRNRQHHYISNGLINGQEVTFLVDTGATHVALSADLAEKLGLVRGTPGIAITANGRTRTYATRIDRLQIGNIELDDIAASITMGLEDDEILLGMSALKNIEFSQRNGVLTLRQYPN